MLTQRITETTLVKVTSDMVIASDKGHITVLVLMNLSAEFDTIVSHILLQTGTFH